MKFFDYIFYRMYVFYAKKKNERPPLFGAAFVVALIIWSLPGGIWFVIKNYFFPQAKQIIVLIPFFVILYLLWKRYKKMEKLLLKKYKNSKWNSIIPLWAIILFTALSPVIGGSLAIYIQRALEKVGIFIPL